MSLLAIWLVRWGIVNLGIFQLSGPKLILAPAAGIGLLIRRRNR